MEIIIPFGMFFILMFATVSIPVTFLVISIVAYVFMTDIPLVSMAQTMAYNLRSYVLTSILFFVFAGNVMVRGRLSTILINLANALIGSIPGGLAITGILACGLFGAISGSSTAAMAAIGVILVPAMIDFKYSKHFAVSLMTSSGILAMLIPPSIPVILYSVVTGASIGSLFLAGVLPGVITIIFFSAYVYIKSKKLGIKPTSEHQGRPKLLKAVGESVWGIVLVVIILGGIYSGILTVTESAAIGVIWAIFVELVIFKHVKIKDLPQIAVDSAVVTAVIMFVFGSAMVFSQFLTLEQIPNRLAELMISISDNKWIFIALTCLVLLLAGALLDGATVILIFAPLLLPIYKLFGFDDTHFGMIFMMLVYIGNLTPPVGFSLFAAVGIFRIKLLDVAKGSIPFMIMLMAVLVLVILLPFLSTWLPRLVMR